MPAVQADTGCEHAADLPTLLITDGAGIIATESEQREVRAGDFVLIPAGERHWHGARPDEPMAHLAVGIPGTTDFDGAAYTATE